MTRFGGAVLALILAVTDLHSCSIPVFRYAFENWAPASYPVIVYRRGPLTSDQQAVIQKLVEAKSSNIAFVDVDLGNKPDPNWAKFSEQLPAGTEYPILAVRGPDAESPLVWSGPISAANVAAILDSPARREVINRLGRGQTAVFLLLESGDAQKDAVAAKLLEGQVPIMEKIALPKPTAEGPQPKSKLPLKVAFESVRLSRTNAKESIFVRMLLKSEPGLEKVSGPIVMAIFGRGRLLAALHGDDLNAEELGRVAEFLCKACSCQVKELNPGLDLLFTADWEALVTGKSTPMEKPTVNPPAFPAKPESNETPKVERFEAPRTQVSFIVLEGLLPKNWPFLALFFFVLVVGTVAITRCFRR